MRLDFSVDEIIAHILAQIWFHFVGLNLNPLIYYCGSVYDEIYINQILVKLASILPTI